MAYYAWTDIKYGAKVDKDDTYLGDKVIATGETVTADKLNLSKDQFQELIDSGAVREEKYPVPEGSNLSPREHYLQKAREMEEGAVLGTRGSIFAPDETSELEDLVEETKSGSS